MIKLRDELQKIVDGVFRAGGFLTTKCYMDEAALRIQEYIDAKEPVMLTDAEIELAFWRFDAKHKGLSDWKSCPMSERDAFKSEIRRAIAAFIAKQREPQKRTVTVRIFTDVNGRVFPVLSPDYIPLPSDRLKATQEIEFDV